MSDAPQPPSSLPPAAGGSPASVPAAVAPSSTPPAIPGWEYRVIHINVDNNAPPGPPDPKADSARLGGALSPEFLQNQFPQQYDAAKAKAAPRHPAEQLQFFLNMLGKEGWEMVEAAQVGPMLMFFFKRPALPPSPPLSPPTPPATSPPPAEPGSETGTAPP